MVRARTPAVVRSEWSRFLVAAGRVYSKLEKGAKGHPKAEPWFGKAKADRKADQLLSYVHHARNAEEHGIADITIETAESITINGGGFAADAIEGLPGGRIAIKGLRSLNPDNPAVVEYAGPRVDLLPVRDDRFPKDRFDPPTEHLGERLQSGSIAEVSTLTLRYLERLVRDAGQFSRWI